jgi:hypothetical protein
MPTPIAMRWIGLVVGQAAQHADELVGHGGAPLRRLLVGLHHGLVLQQHRVGGHEQFGEGDGQHGPIRMPTTW